MEWRYLIAQYKWHIFLALLALVLYILFLGPNNPLGYRIILPAPDVYSTCHRYCQFLSGKYVSVEIAIQAIQGSWFCQDPDSYDSVEGNCVEYIGECEMTLYNGTQITLGCD